MAFDKDNIDNEIEPCIKPRHEQAMELSIFLILIVPSMLLSFFATRGGDGISFVLLATSTIFRDIGLLCVVLFFLWRNSEPLRLVGWNSHNVLREIGVGILLFLPFIYISTQIQEFLLTHGFSQPPTMSQLVVKPGAIETVLAIALVFIVAITEETIFRGYITLRLKNISGRAVWAVIGSAVLFSIGHGYEGTAGVFTIGILGLLFSLVYLWRGTLTAPVTMHFLYDFSAMVLLPWLNQHH